jgi:hypothetical protein
MALFPLGILSAAAGAGGAPAGPSDYELIETKLLTTTTSSITFSNLGDYSSTYKHLQVRWTARSSSGNTFQDTLIRMNGATSGYASHYINANGGGVSSESQPSSSRIYILGGAIGGGAGSGNFGMAVMDLLDSYSTSKNKTVRILAGRVVDGQMGIHIGSGFLNSTDAISSIEVYPDGGHSWVSGCRFSIYGVKG